MIRFILTSLLCLLSILMAHAQDKNIGINHPIVFLRPSCTSELPNDVEIDCFYKYSSTVPVEKLINKNNRYYPADEKVTIADSVFNKRFLIIGTEGTNPKKGTCVLLTDDKGDTLFLALPKYNPAKESYYHGRSFARSCIKNNKHIESPSSPRSFLSLPAKDLSHFEAQLDTLYSTIYSDFHHEALPLPTYTLLSSTYKDFGEPSYKLLVNSRDTVVVTPYKLGILTADIKERYRRIPALLKLISENDSAAKKIGLALANRDLWMPEECLVPDKNLENIPVLRNCNGEYSHIYSPKEQRFHKPDWMEEKCFSDGNLLTLDPSFYKIPIDTIIVSFNHNLDLASFGTYGDRKVKIEEFPDSLYFRYYLRAKPHSINSETYYTELLIPLDLNNPPQLFTQEEMDQNETEFYCVARKQWENYTSGLAAYREIATRVWGKEIASIVCKGEVRLGFDEDMCHFAFRELPFRTSNEATPLGRAECHNFYTEGVRMYFQNKILIGLEWKGNKLFEPHNRFSVQ